MASLILTIDDCQDHRLLMTALLEILGYRSMAASEGTTALRLAQRHQPALILLDICMPGLDGNTVVRLLKQNAQTAAIPVVAVTAMVRRREQFLADGFDDYLAKPYTIESLDHIIQRHLAVSQAT
jgi:two-component system, cell cycle response regulator DivK